MALVPSIVILTGAGISAESGLQTFRASDGLWCDHRVEDVATPEAFRRNPGLVQGFYNQRRAQLKAVEPNAAHEALARLEAEWPGDFLLVTQNVDDLHDRARRVQGLLDRSSPSPRFFHMHGELKRVRCQRSGEVFAWEEDVLPETECACCRRVGSLRPDIVWFGEMPMHMEEIGDALRQCDLFLSIGTSGAVYPAAGFVHEAAIAGAHTVEINLEPTQRGSLFDEKIYGPASVEVVKYVERLMRQHHVV